MSFRLNRTLNRKSEPTLDDLVEMSPYLKFLHSHKKGKNTTLLDAYKDHDSSAVSSRLAGRGFKIVATGIIIVTCVFYMMLRKDVELTQARKKVDLDREKYEGSLLLSQKLSSDHS